ncbi:VOC family protein [Pontivivens nitratireducens]|uniref:VOC family protein n=1 Tax=Pontivivens nitratireducens TaxID=2758038 RepID=UPI00197C365B|nr:VOC family protein [Pontibrevibacter nitratireducens]
MSEKLGKREDASSAVTFNSAMGIASSDVSAMKKVDGPDSLTLSGVDHTARPTWKLNETVEFYRDVLGLPLVHAISARGWGPPGHHDFLHFFFDAGKDATIAFFYYIGSEQPERYIPEEHHFYFATHTAWAVDTEEELIAWKEALTERGVKVSPYTKHEILESIYFLDPNGYPVEITRRLRETEKIDEVDAMLTLKAAMEVEREARDEGQLLADIDTVWRRKAAYVRAYQESDT